MRVGLIALLHESNTFASETTGLDAFERDHVLTGAEVISKFAQSRHEMGGFLRGLAEERLECVPVFSARATPSGTITAEAFEALLSRMIEALTQAGPLDGILVAPHGATVSEAFPDADGEWLRRVRAFVGADTPIIGTIDAHANLTPLMIASTNALIAYRTNPHLDQFDRGVEAARLLARTLRGECAPVQRAVFPPLAINIEKQKTHDSPCRELYQLADEILTRDGMLANSVVLGFPYSDVAEMGTSFIVVADGNSELALAYADELAAYAWDERESFVGEFVSLDGALDEVVARHGPVLLLDMGDNVGGGSSADGTLIARALHERKIGPSFVCLFDRESAEQARIAGVGAKCSLKMGGKVDRLHGEPLEADVTVRSLHDGRFEESEVRHGGWTHFDMGPTAVVQTEHGLTIMLTSERVFPVSLNQLLSCGLAPESFRVIVAKGVQAPVAAYEPVCKHIIRVNTPGSTCADMTKLPFEHRRRPMFPFERDAAFTPAS